ncbi:MAG: hypothetical protein DRG32_01330 [Deltaproteobacteria bacterium]|nr:MAG: hypothetical protein DRG32_01330 [Deltaproteobacteria bacterium]
MRGPLKEVMELLEQEREVLERRDYKALQGLLPQMERAWGRLREEDFQEERGKVREVLKMIEECSRLLDERMREVIGHWVQLERFRRGLQGYRPPLAVRPRFVDGWVR